VKNNRIPLVTTVLFFVSIALLFGYLLAMRSYSPLPSAVFWVAVVTAILVVVFQIIRAPWPHYEVVLITEILLLGIALRMIYQIPYPGLSGTDSYNEVWVLRNTLEHGHFVAARPEDLASAYWPLSGIAYSQLCLITDITPFDIGKWAPSIINSSFILLLYLVIKRVFNNEKVALLSILLMVTLQCFSEFTSGFKNANLALIIMMVALYFLTEAKGNERVKFACLAILGSFAVIITHHFTSLIWLVFILLSLATIYISTSFGGKHLSPKTTLTVTTTFALLVFVATFSYWLYAYEQPLVALTRWGQTLISGPSGEGTAGAVWYATSPETIVTIRGHVLFYGFWIFHAIFAAILVYSLIFQRKGKPAEFYSFTSFLFLLGILGLLQYFVMPLKPVDLDPNRVLMLGWIWGFAPLAYCIWESKREWLKKSGIIILAAFMLFNIYMIPPQSWNPEAEGQPGSVLEEDYALARTITLSDQATVMGLTANLAFYDVEGILSKPVERILSIEELDAFDCIVINKEVLRGSEENAVRGAYHWNIDVLNKVGELSRGDRPGERNKIYQSNNLIVLK